MYMLILVFYLSVGSDAHLTTSQIGPFTSELACVEAAAQATADFKHGNIVATGSCLELVKP